MNKSTLYLFLTLALLGCENPDQHKKGPDDPSPAGEPITKITMGIGRPLQSRVGVDIGPTRDTYFWTTWDAIMLCEVDEAGVFTGRNYPYGIKSIPAHGAAAEFEGVNAVTTGKYIAVHTRKWDNVSLPTAAGKITFRIPSIWQSATLATNPEAAQAFADNLFFSTAVVTGEQLLAGQVTLNHQLIQVEVELTGQAADAGKKIARVELSPATANGYAQSLTIDPAGSVTAVGGGIPTTVVLDPAATLDASYKVRLLTRPTSLTENNGGSFRVYSGLESSPLSDPAPATTFELGNIYTLARQVGPVDQPLVTTAMTAPTYIGAFWKKSHVGERMIRINTQDAGDTGNWIASVLWKDDNWAADDIMLTTRLAENTNQFELADTPPIAVPSFVAQGTATSGTDGEPIFFRIGLKSTYTPTANAPARYAIVLLSYNNRTKNHLIYLRQGEDPAVIGQATPSVAWTVYNVGEYQATTSFKNGGFVGYPSQAGQFKRWTTKTYLYSPVNTAPGSNWKDDKHSSSYTYIQKVCPTGYKIPTSQPSSLDGGDMASLFAGTNVAIGKPIFGYYADGWFDRQTIGNATGTNGAPLSAVFRTSYNVGYHGFLVVDQTTNASLFFPCAGSRLSGTTGPVTNAGQEGRYWSSTTPQSNSFNSLYLDRSGVSISLRTLASSADGTEGYTIRCIKE